MRIYKRCVFFLVLLAFTGLAQANPIPWPRPASMPLEDMYAYLDETDEGGLRETFVGNYYFSYIPEEVGMMKYPVPPKSEGISVAMGKLPEDWSFSHEIFPLIHEQTVPMELLRWFYIRELYPTVLPEPEWANIPMIAWNGPFPEKALFSVKYQHDLLRRTNCFVYFYALGTGKYYETYQKEAISYLDITMPTDFTMTNLFLDKTPHAFAETTEREGTERERRVVSVFASAEFGPFKKDIIGFIKPVNGIEPCSGSAVSPQIRFRYKVERCDTALPVVIKPSIIPSGNMMLVSDYIYFNCCPEYVRMTIVVDGKNVIFREKAMEEAPCDCICYYPMKGEAGPFAPGTYQAQLINPYGKVILEKEIVIPSPPPPCEGDFDRDGDVDIFDLGVFAKDFGRTDCPKCILLDEINALKMEIEQLKAVLVTNENKQ